MKDWEERALFYKSMLLITVSTLALTRALWTIRSSRSRGTDTTARRFASGMMVVLFSFELLECIVWLVGVPLAATANGAAPWRPQDPQKVDRWCYPIGLANYWLHYCMFLWQLVLAYNIWAWVVKRESVSVLNGRIIPYLIAVLALSSALSIIPVMEQNLGLWANNVCFLKRAWHHGRATVSLIMHRLIMLPLCSLLILVFNASTVCRLRQEALAARQSGLPTAHSSNRLQTRLVIVAVVFVTVQIVHSIPFYIQSQDFYVDFLTRWLFAVGLLDVLVFTYDWDAIKNSAFCSCLLPCFRWSDLKGFSNRSRYVSSSVWETMMPRPVRLSTLAGAPTMATNNSWLSGASSSSSLRAMAVAAGDLIGGSGSSLCRRHVLCTTFDMHHAQLQPQDLTGGVSSWIPQEGYHVYCILVQRCRGLTKLRQAIQQHLGGVAKYQLCACVEVGGQKLSSSQDKMALIIFARTVDVESGAFRVVGSDEQALAVPAPRGGCKGLVCVSFRYYDMSVAVLGIDMPSQADVDTTEARDKLISSMLHSMRLQADHELYDTHLQWHHVVLMGSFKYGAQPSSSAPTETLNNMARASHKHQIARYDRILSVHSNQTHKCTADTECKEPGEVDLEGGQATAVKAKVISDWVRDTDALHHRMAHGQALHGFREQIIRFLPSYKWRHGASVDDRCDVSKLRTAFMTERVKTQTPIRPSYADRVLVRSLPAVAGRLVLGPYELCEEGSLAGSSDHRPVSQALTLLVDTTKPLSCLWADNPNAGLDEEDGGRDTTAYAMARAAAARRQQQQQQQQQEEEQQQGPRRSRTWSGAPQGGSLPAAGALPIYYTIALPVTSSTHSTQQFTAILVTLAFRSFNFQFRGFKWLEASPRRQQHGQALLDTDPPTPKAGTPTRYTAALPAPSSPQSVGHESSGDPVVVGGPPRELSYEAGSSDGSELPSATRGYTGDLKGTLDDAAAVAYEKRRSLRTPGFIEEVVISYPLPCEDPLLLLRRSQALEHGLSHHYHKKTKVSTGARPARSSTHPLPSRSLASGDTPDPSTPPQQLPTRLSTFLHATTSRPTHNDSVATMPHTHAHAHYSGSTTTTTHRPTREYPLQNTFRVPWRQGLHSSGTGIMGADGGGDDAACLQLDILTLGSPPPRPTHALIKFIGRGGRHLGQGVICVSGGPAGGTTHATPHPQTFMQRMLSGSGAHSPVSSNTVGSPSARHTHAQSRTQAHVYRGGVGGHDGGCGGWGQHVVDLSVGGDLRGSVSMDVGIKARMKVAVQVPTPPLSDSPSVSELHPDTRQHPQRTRTHRSRSQQQQQQQQQPRPQNEQQQQPRPQNEQQQQQQQQQQQRSQPPPQQQQCRPRRSAAAAAAPGQ